jgi:type IV secretory pathway VirB2 component (pilin)
MVNHRVLLYVLVGVAAAARLLLQVAALPPYAGLDEVWHVSRLAFVHAEGRNPNIRENSVPRSIASATAGDPAFPADFGHIGARWPEVVRARNVLVDHAVEVKPYIRPNIEAQQPRLYYSVVGRLLPPHLSQLGELRFWRLLSVVFGVIIALATARIGETFFGARGIAAAALLASLPTWETLVARASNDGFACMWLALALACTFAEANAVAEGVCWALAVATKLYTWPAMVILLLRRRWTALGACAVSIAVTVFDLATRTRNPLGVLGFDPASQSAAPQPIHYLEMIKITLASAVWTSGQHWDALTLRGMLLYAVPMVGLLGLGVARSRGGRETARLRDVAAALLAFAAAQVVHAYGYVRRARAMGLALPAAGKEGWFWYALAPLVVGLLFPAAPLALLAVWLVGWDVVITEGALFHDFAGATSPAHGTWLFRWGPWHAPFTADLSRVAVGPFASQLIVLRIVHVGAVIAAFVLESRLHDRNADTSR